MIKLKIAGFAALICSLSVPAMAQAAGSAKDWKPLNTGFLYIVVGVVVLATFITFSITFRILSDHTTWSLADALSEEADITVDDANGQPVKKTVLAASTSRLIAFIGTIAILSLYLGFGAIILCEYGKTGQVSNADTIAKYLLAGLTLFAPYVVNKFSSVFAPK
jgi:hypothetical protein